MKRIWLSLVVSGALAFGADRALISDDYSNYFSTAKEIPLNMAIEGSIETAGDIDIFKFTLSEDDGVNISLKNNGDGRVDLYIIEKSTIEVLSDYLNEENWDIRSDVENNIKNILNLHSFSEETSSVTNLNPNEYYIVIIPINSSLTTPYTFRIESEENTGNVELDKITLEYCKTHLSECGIEVDSSLKYTQSDLDSAKETAKEEGKEELRDELKLSKTKVEALDSGWSLVGTCENVEDNTIFNSASSVWSYKDGSWSHNPSKIEAFDGFWIKK